MERPSPGQRLFSRKGEEIGKKRISRTVDVDSSCCTTEPGFPKASAMDCEAVLADFPSPYEFRVAVADKHLSLSGLL